MQNNIDTIKKSVLKVQGVTSLQTKQATKKADNKLIKLVDSVMKSEYCTSTSKTDRFELLDFND